MLARMGWLKRRMGAKVNDLSALPSLERLQHYLDLADDARREGARAAGSARESFFMSAQRLEQLAADTARQMRHGH